MMAFSATCGYILHNVDGTAHIACHTVRSHLDHLEVMTRKYTLDVVGQNDHQLRGQWILSNLVFTW
jgi:hypothetical protein